MDAMKLIEERKRLCKMYPCCSECPAWSKNEGCKLSITSEEEAEKQVELIEEWSAAHPRKTRQSVFLEQYPNARIDSQAVIYVCPADAYGDRVCPKNEENFHMLCRDCRRNFWLQKVE